MAALVVRPAIEVPNTRGIYNGSVLANGYNVGCVTRNMWRCPKCGEQHDDQFLGSCWKCAGESKPPSVNPIRCPRCPADLEFVGTKRFHEGADGGFFGMGELFVNRESFDVYVCPRCGRVEFFVDGIGEEFRPK